MPSPTPSNFVGQAYCLDTAGNPAAGVIVSFRAVNGPTGSGEAYEGTPQHVVSDGTGQVQLPMTQGQSYKIWSGRKRPIFVEISADASSPYTLPSFEYSTKETQLTYEGYCTWSSYLVSLGTDDGLNWVLTHWLDDDMIIAVWQGTQLTIEPQGTFIRSSGTDITPAYSVGVPRGAKLLYPFGSDNSPQFCIASVGTLYQTYRTERPQ
jgi:hypothetical protein